MSPTADDLAPSPPDRPPAVAPAWAASRPRPPVNIGLRGFMVVLVYFAVAFLAGRAVWEEGSSLAGTFLGFWIGIGLIYVGAWLVTRLRRLALAGWFAIFAGQIIASCSILGTMIITLPVSLSLFGIGSTAELPIILPGPMAWPAILIFDGVVIYLRVQHRRSRQDGLLWVLALAADRGLPLAPGVEAYAQQQGGTYREWAHVLAGLLSEGRSLASALEAVPRAVPWDAPILARAGEESGQLAEALRTAAEIRSRRHHALRDVFGRVGYLVGTLFALLIMIVSINHYILPQYGAILNSLQMEAGPATTFLVQGAEVLEKHFRWPAWGLMAILAYLSLALGLRGWAGLPVVGRLFRLRHRALILRCLALPVRAGRPIDPTVALLARRYPSRPVRRRLRRAGEQMARGIGWTDALRFARLIGEAEVGVLDAAGRAGNLPWALVALADSGERRFAYRLQFATQILFALTLLILAAAILFVALALFLPLVTVIEGLAE